jgi:predicted DNA-binding protein
MIHVDLTSELEAQLQAVAVDTGRSMEEHVREALIQYIEELEDRQAIRASLAAMQAGEPTVSMDDYLAARDLAD